MGVTVVREPGAGERIGEAFSGSVQGLLKGLVESKLQTMQKEKLAERQEKTYQAHRQQNIDGLTKYWEMQGYPHAEAVAFAEQGPAFAKSVMDRMEGFSLGGGQQQQQQMQQQPQQMQQQPTAEGNLYSSMGIPEYNAQIDPNMLTGLGAGATMQPGMQQGAMQPAGQPPAGGLRIGPPPAERRHRENLALKKESLEQKDRLQGRKEIAKDKQEDKKELRQNRIENRKGLQVSKKKHEDAQVQLDSYDRLEELEDQKQLDSPLRVKILDKMGLGWMLSPGSQEYNSISKNLFRDLGPTGIAFEAFMKAIPSLTNSSEGRRRIIKNMKAAYKIIQTKHDAVSETLKKNRDIDPLDLELQANELSSKKAEGIRKDLVKDLGEFIEVDTGFAKKWNEGKGQWTYIKLPKKI